MKNEVINFIKHFEGSEDTFLHGCCYWFAHILQERFNDRGYIVEIFHEPIEGHFVARFIPTSNKDTNGIRFYDIRGDVSDLYKIEDLENIWDVNVFEHKRFSKLMCDCRDFIEPEDYPPWIRF